MFIHKKHIFLIPYDQPQYLQHLKPLYDPPGLPETEEDGRKQQQQKSKSTKITQNSPFWSKMTVFIHINILS